MTVTNRAALQRPAAYVSDQYTIFAVLQYKADGRVNPESTKNTPSSQVEAKQTQQISLGSARVPRRTTAYGGSHLAA
eukprot:2965107-Rhodomonas_salina.2